MFSAIHYLKRQSSVIDCLAKDDESYTVLLSVRLRLLWADLGSPFSVCVSLDRDKTLFFSLRKIHNTVEHGQRSLWSGDHLAIRTTFYFSRLGFGLVSQSMKPPWYKDHLAIKTTLLTPKGGLYIKVRL